MKADLRKEQILKVAEKMFSMNGYHETFVEDIIKEAKIGKGTYYRYFKNKEDIYITLLKKVLLGWEENAFINPVQLKSDNIADLFKELIKRSLKFFFENNDLCNIYLCVNRGNDQLFKPYINRFEKQMLEHITTYLKEGIKLGFVRKDLNIELTSNIIAGAYLRVGYYYFVQNKNKGRKINIDEITEDFFNSTMKGILIN
jgi:TetR/AcrR family transcriptional regulator, fatty acid metabolism regulator protein